MNKLFVTDMTKTRVKRPYQSDEDEADSLQNSWMAKKRSMLPKNNFVKSF